MIERWDGGVGDGWEAWGRGEGDGAEVYEMGRVERGIRDDGEGEDVREMEDGLR